MITRKQKVIRGLMLAVALIFSLPASAVSGVFTNNKATVPNNSDLYAGEQLQIQHYVPVNYSDAELRNVVNKVARDLGSRSDRQIYIVWTDKQSQKLANMLKKAFIKKKVNDKQLTVTKSQYQRDIYPLYIEMHSFDAKKRDCRIQTAEIHFYSAEPDSCAIKNNIRVQSNNPTIQP